MSYYTYVLPCVWEDHCKVGFSRDPLSRLQALHRRWYEFFDLGRGLLVEAETEREARDLELKLRRPLAGHRAPMPGTVRRQAGGHTEWLRGAGALLQQAVQQLSAQGYVVHAPLRPWLRAEMLARSDRLYHWADALKAAWETGDEGALQVLRDGLDAYAALSIDPRPWLPSDIAV